MKYRVVKTTSTYLDDSVSVAYKIQKRHKLFRFEWWTTVEVPVVTKEGDHLFVDDDYKKLDNLCYLPSLSGSYNIEDLCNDMNAHDIKGDILLVSYCGVPMWWYNKQCHHSLSNEYGYSYDLVYKNTIAKKIVSQTVEVL